MSKVTPLASGQINPSDNLTIELVEIDQLPVDGRRADPLELER